MYSKYETGTINDEVAVGSMYVHTYDAITTLGCRC